MYKQIVLVSPNAHFFLADYKKRPSKRLDLFQLVLSLSYSFCHFGLLKKTVRFKQGLILDREKKSYVF